MLPKSITLLTDAFVSLDRIESLIFEAEKYDKDLFKISLDDEDEIKIEKNDLKNDQNVEEYDEENDFNSYNNINNNYDDNHSYKNYSKKSEMEDKINESDKFTNIDDNTEIVLKTVTAVRSKNMIILRGLSVALGPVGLTLIVGNNASGKTSLLLSIINELSFTEGEVTVHPTEVRNKFLDHILS